MANVFQLRTYWDVEVTKVEPKDVSVDLVELLLKDQFVSRSEILCGDFQKRWLAHLFMSLRRFHVQGAWSSR